MIGAVLALQFIGPAAAPPPAPAAQPKPCLAKGEEISGEMRWVESRHVGNHKDLRVPFIVLVEPRCVRDATGARAGRWVQLGLTIEAMKKLKPGDTVTVKGDYIVPFTAYHLGDIVAMDAVVVKETAP